MVLLIITASILGLQRSGLGARLSPRDLLQGFLACLLKVSARLQRRQAFGLGFRV